MVFSPDVSTCSRKWCNMGDWHLKTASELNAPSCAHHFIDGFHGLPQCNTFYYHHSDIDQRKPRFSMAGFDEVSCQSRQVEINLSNLIREWYLAGGWGAFFMHLLKSEAETNKNGEREGNWNAAKGPGWNRTWAAAVRSTWSISDLFIIILDTICFYSEPVNNGL